MPTDSTYPAVDIPDVDLWTFLFERKDRPYPDGKVIYVDGDTGRAYSYHDVKTAGRAFGEGLKATWRWRKGDVLALFSPNSIDTPALTWGCHWAGGVVSPANAGYTVGELAFQLRDTGAKALVTQWPLIHTARQAARDVGLPDDRIILLGDQRDPHGTFKHFDSIRNLSSVEHFPRATIQPEHDLAFLVYSSGTTGLPKGVMLTHRNIVANLLMIEAGEGGNLTWNGGRNGQGDQILGFLPFFHIYGLTNLIHLSLYLGLSLVVMAKFELERWCQLVQERSITFSFVVPPVVLLLSKHPVVSKYDLSSIRMMNCGAAPLTRGLVEALHARLKIPIKQGYGLSETSPVTHLQPWSEWNETIGSVGRLVPNLTSKLMIPDGKEVPEGETGELWVKGPNVFKGYHNNPSSTAAAITVDGFFKTGDVGYHDARQNFYITDRVKELIKYKGFQVAPAELEGILLTHEAVVDSAVIGLYDEDSATEVPRAYVVLAEGQKPTPETAKLIADFVTQKTASHKRLRGGVSFVSVIPKSASGKILRRVLRDKAEAEASAAKKAGLQAKL